MRVDDVRGMLGLADRARIIDLFEALMRADLAGALRELRDQYDAGADPAMVLGDLAEFTHFVTRVKIVPAVADDVSLTESERTRGRAFATKLSMRVLARTWQMLLKGIAEVEAAGRPIAAAEMVLVRIAYAADLPTPDEVIRSLGDASVATAAPSPPRGGGNGGATSTLQTSSPRAEAPRGAPRAALVAAAPAVAPEFATNNEPVARDTASTPARSVPNFEALVALATEKRDIAIKSALERDVRLVRFEDGKLEIALEASAARTLTGELVEKAFGLDRPALDGRRLRRTGRAQPPRPGADAQGRAERRRARRSFGAGGAGALSRRRNRRCAPARAAACRG